MRVPGNFGGSIPLSNFKGFFVARLSPFTGGAVPVLQSEMGTPGRYVVDSSHRALPFEGIQVAITST